MVDSGERGPEARPPMLQRARVSRRLWAGRVKGGLIYVSIESFKYFAIDS